MYHKDPNLDQMPVSTLGDGKCDGGSFNIPECGFDDGDCVKCNERVTDITKIGKYILRNESIFSVMIDLTL